MSQTHADKTLPLSRPLEVAAVGEAGLRQTITADDAECRELASLCGLVAIEHLSAALLIRREGRRGLRVTGEVVGRVRRTCVVTLEDFDTDLAEPFDVRFQSPDEIDAEIARRAKAPADAARDEDQDDLPDAIVNGRIDLGALVGEFLALGLDPYPRKPDTVFVEPEVPPGSAEESPFAVLGRLKPS